MMSVLSGCTIKQVSKHIIKSADEKVVQQCQKPLGAFICALTPKAPKVFSNKELAIGTVRFGIAFLTLRTAIQQDVLNVFREDTRLEKHYEFDK